MGLIKPQALPLQRADLSDFSKQVASCGKHLRVATYNFWNINPPWPERRQRIAELLGGADGADVDIVGVQEVRVTEEGNQLQQVAAKLPGYSVRE